MNACKVCGKGAPDKIKLRYTGDHVLMTGQPQLSSIVGDVNSASAVTIYFADFGASAQVNIGDEFVVEGDFHSETTIHVKNASGQAVLQAIDIHTSCYVPLD